MSPITGVELIKETAERIIAHFEGELADLVVCDGAPDVTGMHDMDQYVQAQLLLSALNITTHVLAAGGTFVAKIFRGKDVTLLYSQLKLFFTNVAIVKPRSSRNASLEAFVLCQNYSPPPAYIPTMEPMLAPQYSVEHPFSFTQLQLVCALANELISTKIPFHVCGSLSGYDANTNYAVEEGHVSLDPVHPPIDPPYRDAVQAKRSAK